VTHLTNFTFDGAKADLSKSLSMDPAFQVQHSFSLAKAQEPPSYNFGAVFAKKDVRRPSSSSFGLKANERLELEFGQLTACLRRVCRVCRPLALPPGQHRQRLQLVGAHEQAVERVDDLEDPGSGALPTSARLLDRLWLDPDIRMPALSQLSPVPGHSMVQLEQEFVLPGETINLKAINPSLTDGTGIYLTSALVALTPRFSLGFENVLQKPTPEISQSVTSLLAKWTSALTPGSLVPTPMAPSGTPAFHEWTATLQAQAAGVLSATYHHRLSDKVDVGADLNVVLNGGRREATATVGAKYDFRMATFRGQVDSTGKTSMLLEQRFAPTFSFLVTGEIDHMKAGAAKLGLGVMIESTTLTSVSPDLSFFDSSARG